MSSRLAALMLVALGYQALAGAGTQAVAAPSPATIEKAVVIVTARGVLTNLGNAPVATQGTGFFIHRDGYVVTSYHLRKNLGDVDENTVEYAIHFGPNDSDTYRATPIHSSSFFDFMVLYVSVGSRPFEVLRPGSRDGIELGTTPVYTGGYPRGYQFSVDTGVIKSLGTVDPIPVWATNLTFKEGQSGSPIIRNDLRVIAFAKGNDADSTSIGLVVPVSSIPANYWDGTFKLDAKAESALLAAGNQAPPTVYAQIALDGDAPAQRKVTFNLHNETCEESSSKTYRIAATEGWAIDPASISVERLSSRGESSRFAVTDRNAEAFNISVELNNIGKCLRVFNRTIPAGVPAEFTGVATYTELPATAERLVTVSAATPLGEVQSPLPDVELNRFRFSIRKPDGTIVGFTPTSDELKKKHGVMVLNNKKVADRVLGGNY